MRKSCSPWTFRICPSGRAIASGLIFSAEHDCVLERRAVDQRQREYRNMIERLRQAWPGLVIFDPFPVICPEATCTPIRGEFSLYRDKDSLEPHRQPGRG
jgi:hypothetical protein